VTLKAHGLDVKPFVARRPGGWHQPQALVDAAHQVCPYSHATRGNIDVTINVV